MTDIISNGLRIGYFDIILGKGTLFKQLTERNYIKLVSAEQRDPGKVYLIYSRLPK